MKRDERLGWKCKRVDVEQEKNYKLVDLLKSNWEVIEIKPRKNCKRMDDDFGNN